MGAPGRIELSLPSTPASVAEARARLLDALASELSDEELATLRLLVSELVTNAIRHARSTRPLELRAHWDGDIRVEVVDHGDGFAPRPRTGGLEEPGGFGLYLVGQLADRWGVETDEATCVWFVLGRNPARGAPQGG